jgi:hypothetical protein
MNEILAHWFLRVQLVAILFIGYAFHLAVSNETVDQALSGVERISQWPVQALNIGLFVLVLGICWLYLQSTRKDLQKLQQANTDERREYIESLKTLVADTGKIVERNNAIFERIDRQLDRGDRH